MLRYGVRQHDDIIEQQFPHLSRFAHPALLNPSENAGGHGLVFGLGEIRSALPIAARVHQYGHILTGQQSAHDRFVEHTVQGTIWVLSIDLFGSLPIFLRRHAPNLSSSSYLTD